MTIDQYYIGLHRGLNPAKHCQVGWLEVGSRNTTQHMSGNLRGWKSLVGQYKPINIQDKHTEGINANWVRPLRPQALHISESSRRQNSRFANTPLLLNLFNCLSTCRVPSPRRAPFDSRLFRLRNPIRSGLCCRLCLLLIFEILMVPGCFHRTLAIQLISIGQARVFSGR